MKRTMPFALEISSSDDDDKPSPFNRSCKRVRSETVVFNPGTNVLSEEFVTRSAKMYQEYMEQIPIPSPRESVIRFTSWTGLSKSMKQLYKQPLHYLTNVRINEWDQLRIGAKDRLEDIIHPCKAETNIWLMEEVHRLTSSYQALAKLWMADTNYYAFVDPHIHKK